MLAGHVQKHSHEGTKSQIMEWFASSIIAHTSASFQSPALIVEMKALGVPHAVYVTVISENHLVRGHQSTNLFRSHQEGATIIYNRRP